MKKYLLTLMIVSMFSFVSLAQKTSSETLKMSGIEMVESLSADGTELIELPYKWYMGIGESDNKNLAVEMATRDAYATISRIINNTVNDVAEKAVFAINNNVQSAVQSHWTQVSESILRGCEAFGDVRIERDNTSGIYTAYAKVAIRGDRFNKLLNEATSIKTDNMNAEDVEKMVELNNTILEAVK